MGFKVVAVFQVYFFYMLGFTVQNIRVILVST